MEQFGIEFLSRGAKEAYFCEKNHLAIKMIYENLTKTKLTTKAVVLHQDYKRTLELLRKEKKQFDIIYLDPPYLANIAVDSVKRILSLNLLNEKGCLIIETDDEKRELLELKELKTIEIYDIRKYGRVSLIFLAEKK